VTKGAGSKAAALAMAYKLLITAQERRRRFNGHELISEVLDGATFKDGVKVTDDEATTQDEKLAASKISCGRSTTFDNCSPPTGGTDASPGQFAAQRRDRAQSTAIDKTIAYAPYPVWIYLNGHEWAKRQAHKRGIAFDALDNGFRSAQDAGALQGICASLYCATSSALDLLEAAAALAVHRSRSRPRLRLPALDPSA
jgi:hypothetical protein